MHFGKRGNLFINRLLNAVLNRLLEPRFVARFLFSVRVETGRAQQHIHRLINDPFAKGFRADAECFESLNVHGHSFV